MNKNPHSKNIPSVLKSVGTSEKNTKSPHIETLIKNYFQSESEKKLFKCDFPGCRKTFINAKRQEIHSKSHVILLLILIKIPTRTI
jgi:hypothetical protein